MLRSLGLDFLLFLQVTHRISPFISENPVSILIHAALPSPWNSSHEFCPILIHFVHAFFFTNSSFIQVRCSSHLTHSATSQSTPFYVTLISKLSYTSITYNWVGRTMLFFFYPFHYHPHISVFHNSIYLVSLFDIPNFLSIQIHIIPPAFPHIISYIHSYTVFTMQVISFLDLISSSSTLSTS